MSTAGMYLKAKVVGGAEGLDRGWQERAACRDSDPGIFFPERGDNAAVAKAVCLSCPVQAACLEYALVTFERFGVWGGKSERERRQMRNRRRAERLAS